MHKASLFFARHTVYPGSSDSRGRDALFARRNRGWGAHRPSLVNYSDLVGALGRFWCSRTLAAASAANEFRPLSTRSLFGIASTSAGQPPQEGGPFEASPRSFAAATTTANWHKAAILQDLITGYMCIDSLRPTTGLARTTHRAPTPRGKRSIMPVVAAVAFEGTTDLCGHRNI